MVANERLCYTDRGVCITEYMYTPRGGYRIYYEICTQSMRNPHETITKSTRTQYEVETKSARNQREINTKFQNILIC